MDVFLFLMSKKKIILRSFVILQIAHYFLLIYFTEKIEISTNDSPFLELSYLFVPIFEEFILLIVAVIVLHTCMLKIY